MTASSLSSVGLVPTVDAVVAEAADLRHALVAGLPGDLGRIVGRMVGDGPPPLDGASTTPQVSPLAWAVPVVAHCCLAYGQPARLAVPVGVCCDLLGVVSAVLDAAEDGHADQIGAYFVDSSATAESYPGKHTQLALTVNAGVALIGLAWEALLVHGPQYGLPPATLLALGQVLTTRWATICAAQQRDLTAGRAPELPLEDYEQIITGKAGEIGGVTTEAGAILAGAERWRGLWHTVGLERTILQQLADDAKDLAQDLAAGQQLSQAVRYGLAVANAPQKTQLLDLLRQVQDPPSPALRQRLVQLLEELGAVQYVLVQMEIHRQRALTALAALPLPETAATWFRAWIDAAGGPAFGDNAPLGEA